MPKAAFLALDLSIEYSRPFLKTDQEVLGRETVKGDL